MNAPPLSAEELNEVYQWVDQLSLSRPKKNITRDFSDGVLLAEIMSHYFPKFVELQNYVTSNSANQKLSNWNTLNKKVLKKINYQISKQDIQHIITNTPDIIERVLKVTQSKIKTFIQKSKNLSEDKSQVPKEVLFKKISQNQQLKEFLSEKDNSIQQLKSAIEIFETKIFKMEELIKIKDTKIQSLMTKLQQSGTM